MALTVKKRKINLLYVLGTFPVPSETFIQRELLEVLRDKNLNVRVISFRKGIENIPIPPELKSKITYFRPEPFKIFSGNAIAFFRSPIKYLGLAGLILFGEHNRFFFKVRDFGALLLGAALSGEIKNWNIDHIHAHFATWPTTIALVVSSLNGIPFSFTAHAHDIYIRQMMLKEKISRAKAVIAISDFNRKYLQGLARPADRSKISTVYLGVDFKALRFPKRKEKNAIPQILSIGRLVPQKGFRYLIEALDLVKKKNGKFKAAIVGGGPGFEELENLIKVKGLGGEVELLGPLLFVEVRKRLANADIFVSPSVKVPDGNIDGIPVVLFEAMAAKLPIVSTRVSGIPEAVKDGETGLLVKEKDAEGLAEAIGTLLSNRKLREKFGEAGFKRAKKMFDLHKNVEEFKKVILGGMLN
jgi:glycosyltransferase involved in cell wall biosynthesis